MQTSLYAPNVPPELVAQTIAPYKRGFRYLQSARMEFENRRATATGEFLLNATEYLDEGTIGHLTDVEAQLCLNQLSYVFCRVGAEKKQLRRLGDFPPDEFLLLMKQRSYIVASNKTFRWQTDPAARFLGELKFEYRCIHPTYQFHATFNLNNGACTGSLVMAVRLPP